MNNPIRAAYAMPSRYDALMCIQRCVRVLVSKNAERDMRRLFDDQHEKEPWFFLYDRNKMNDKGRTCSVEVKGSTHATCDLRLIHAKD